MITSFTCLTPLILQVIGLQMMTEMTILSPFFFPAFPFPYELAKVRPVQSLMSSAYIFPLFLAELFLQYLSNWKGGHLSFRVFVRALR